MARATQPSHRWTELDGLRTSFLDRCEQASALTIPKVCPPSEYTQFNDSLGHDYQSVGAQAVNHLTNKIMLAAFAPSRPFVRLDPGPQVLADAAQAGVDEGTVKLVLAEAERKMVRALDQKGIRPKIYSAIRHLIVVGTVMLCMEDKFRVIGLRQFVCKRDVQGEVIEMLIREVIPKDELEAELQPYCTKQDEQSVVLFKWFKRVGDHWEMTQWLDNEQLPDQFNGRWKLNKCPYKVIAWDLADTDDYGTGHVEDYGGALRALSSLSEAELDAAIIASEFRWLVSPRSATRPEDFRNSRNGDALSADDGDINMLQSNKSQDLAAIDVISQRNIQVIARGFLLNSAMVRDAERVTAQEIRLLAVELETALGGVYSRLASELQLPIAEWLMGELKIELDGTDIEVVIITGLDALSRSGDLDALRGFLGDLAQASSLPPPVLQLLNFNELVNRVAQGWGVDIKDLVKSPEQQQAEQQQAAEQQAIQEATTAGAVAAAETAGAQQV